MKRLKVITSIGLILILSIINYVWANDSIQKDEKLLLKVFNKTEANFLEANVNFTGKILDKLVEIDELETMAEKLKDNLNILGTKRDGNFFNDMNNVKIVSEDFYDMDITNGENFRQIIISGKDKEDRTITIILSSYKDVYGNAEETDLVIDVIENKNASKIERVINRVKEVFKNFNTKPQITTCITGTFKGKLKEKDIYKKITRALQSVDAKKVEGLTDPSVISISAYSPYLKNYIYTGNKKMNINLAVRYNQYEDKTYIWLANPIITIGY
ncbi:YwmB family TATA-box binding protein [Thermohalobacter berrensis]|uniref:TATA-box binding protein n=1 Tax=Thermohalobacter berrensis TaxID=99594 RepID=A0A419T223_9FIRM|nr:YwmB family TATA-box binding protein [Thermohalobacter berrensis]RKD31537.1 hypothetical protein BET03_12535 [Thermohalobacter berrensis]